MFATMTRWLRWICDEAVLGSRFCGSGCWFWVRGSVVRVCRARRRVRRRCWIVPSTSSSRGVSRSLAQHSTSSRRWSRTGAAAVAARHRALLCGPLRRLPAPVRISQDSQSRRRGERGVAFSVCGARAGAGQGARARYCRSVQTRGRRCARSIRCSGER